VTVLSVVLAVLAGGTARGEEGGTATCPACGAQMDASWKYCPFDGMPVGPAPLGAPDDTPQEVLLKFFKAYRDGDADGIQRTLDLQGIVSTMIRRGVDDIGPEGVRSVLRKGFADDAARAIVPVILKVLTSEEMRKEYPIPGQLLHEKTINVTYRLEERAGKATLVPAVRSIAAPVRFRRSNDRWVIAEFPILGR